MSLPSHLRGSAQVLVEGEGHQTETQLKAFLSAAVTLTLGILGSSVLPVPFAFSRLGVLGGLLVASVVSLANALTGTLLLRAAGHLGAHTFESLAYKAAGKGWKAVTEVSLVFLLFGTLCGDYALLADIGRKAIVGLFPGAPSWIHDDPGRIPMIALGLFIVFPLSCLRRIRELEYAAMAGVGLVIILAGVIVQSAASAGFPAIHSGELPLTKISLNADLPEAVAVLSFAFYVQPMLLPLLKEMPQGRVGVNLTCKAVQVVTIAVATVVYATVGVFAAARYGLSTEGDVLVNKWLPGRWDGALDGLVAIYLSLSMVPMVMTMRYQLDSLLTGEYAPYLFRREVALTVFSLLTSLAVALCWPTAAEKMFAVTGATAVCLVCYIIPVAIHLSLYFRGGHSSTWHSSNSGPQRRGSFTVLTSSGPEPAGVLSPDSDLTVTVLPPPRAPHAANLQQLRIGQAERPQHAAGRPKVGQQAGRSGAAGVAAESSEQAPAVLGSVKPAAAAQPLPVQGARAGSVTNVSFDSWLVTGRSRDSLDMAGEGPHLGGSPTLPGSHLPPLAPHQRQHPRQQRPAQPGVSTSEAVNSNGSCHSGDSFEHGCSSHGDGGLEEPLLGSERPAARSSQFTHLGDGRNGRAYKGGKSWRSGGYPSVTDLQGQGCLWQAVLLTQHVGLPVLVMLLGTAFSLGALWLSVAALVR